MNHTAGASVSLLRVTALECMSGAALTSYFHSDSTQSFSIFFAFCIPCQHHH